MKLIVGLGNPGIRYRNTRHNTGFLVIDVFAKRYRIKIKKRAFQGRYGVGQAKKQEVVLFQPLTYMNLSGGAIKQLVSSKLLDKEDLLVISDDVSLPLGEIRRREKGSSGGHNGLQSIIDALGSDFARLRIGIGSTEEISDLAGYVLASFSRKEKILLKDVLERAVESIENWLTA
ncbi:MAG: aminoacyl-tRNA hydrolase [Candidatus Omnitrophota bacterium]